MQRQDLSGSTIPFSHKVRNLGVNLDSNLSGHGSTFSAISAFLELLRIRHLGRHLLSVGCDEETGFIFRSVKAGLLQLFAASGSPRKQAAWPAEYKIMHLVLSLADESHVMQSLCRSDPSTGCQSELGLSTKFPPCAIVAGIYPLLPTCMIFPPSIHLPALCIPQTL